MIMLLKITLTSVGSIALLFILTKIMGCREMSQLSMFDYINSITIGSIAAEMATSLEDNFLEPLSAMIIYTLIIILLAFLAQKSLKFRRFINGKSMILYDNGTLYKGNFKRSKLDICEFLIECRAKGYFNLADIQTAILEPNGKISILPKSIKRPVTPEDLNLNPTQEQRVSDIVLDGIVLKENLKATGNNETWLSNKLKEQNIKSIKDVFLATCDDNNNLSVYVKVDVKNKHDAFI